MDLTCAGEADAVGCGPARVGLKVGSQEPLDLKGPIGSCFCANGAAKEFQEMPGLAARPGVICTEIGDL